MYHHINSPEELRNSGRQLLYCICIAKAIRIPNWPTQYLVIDGNANTPAFPILAKTFPWQSRSQRPQQRFLLSVAVRI